MDSIAGYGSSDDEPNGHTVTIGSTKKTVNAAPTAGLEDQVLTDRLYTMPSTAIMPVNIPFNDLSQALIGPDNPFQPKSAIQKNVLNGHVEEQVYTESDFRTQQRTFASFGYARDPSLIGQGNGVQGSGYIGDMNRAYAMNGATVYDKIPKAMQPKHMQLKRKKKGDPNKLEGDDAYLGPWAGFETETKGIPVGPTEEEEEVINAPGQKSEEVVKSKDFDGVEFGKEKSIFHGDQMYDYQGRTYMHVPQDLDVNLLGDAGDQECFIPKKCIHTWEGHTKGVNAIKFFPKSAHLLLSAGMDGEVMLWDVYHDRQLLRSFSGHNQGVRDICFNNDGTRFLSASYDKTVKLWDTETGKCIKAFNPGSRPYCVKFNPDADKQNIFLTGCASKKIVQFDIERGNVVQEYDQHLGAVNTITFIDENRRFVTTSDDKTIRVWEYDIPVVIKYVAEADMHSMPAVALHPNKKWLAATSLDNQILVFGTGDRFKQNRKKRFAGFHIAGYACQPGFSPDGRFISCGDAEGSVVFWDWKTGRRFTKFKAHDRVVMNTEWHPHETSKVATCSWDGLIKLWD